MWQRASDFHMAGAALAATLLLAGCYDSGQSRYRNDEIGQANRARFGTIIDRRPVDITGARSWYGGAIGASIGSAVGAGSGTGAGALAGASAGAGLGFAAGVLAEKLWADRVGVEYTITLTTGRTVLIAQLLDEGDKVFAIGDAVLVQTEGNYQRVLPAAHLPAEIDPPKQVKIRGKEDDDDDGEWVKLQTAK